MIYRLSHPTKIINTSVLLPASKSLSNRALIIRALIDKPFEIQNLSVARDTELLAKLLGSKEQEINCEDAGTTLRFITAYFALQGQEKIITGSERMKQRPVGELVDALCSLGAKISFLDKTGFPPFKIGKSKLKGGKINTDSSISSQFISALLLIAPCLENGLEIELRGEVVSRPYIDMTLSLLKYFGADSSYNNNTIRILPGKYISKTYTCEPDWSAASYWYEIAALSEGAKINLKNLTKDSLQGDSVIEEMMRPFGVSSTLLKQELQLVKTRSEIPAYFNSDFITCPDLAQTLACTCAGLKITADLKGLQSLRLKETNRAEALQRELYNLNVQTDFCDYSKLKIYGHRPLKYLNRPLKTYNDHRMAMALAPLALKLPFIEIENPAVVQKSYPGFWQDLKNAGFEIKITG